MGEQVSVRVWRQNPDGSGEGSFASYSVPCGEHTTVLDALLYVYEQHDSSLAFRYGCRNRDCGTCGVLVNGGPRLGCLTKLKDGMTLEPLRGVPLLRDLALDMRPYFSEMERLALYIPPGWDGGPKIVDRPKEHLNLSACIECLCCVATCPTAGYGEGAPAAPYTFVKLAQLHFDPRDPRDRRTQARSLSIDRCVDCQQCYCVIGVQIVRDAILPLASSGTPIERHRKRPQVQVHS